MRTRVLAALGLLGGALVACRPAARQQVGHPNILLISIDTLRADHVGSYGYRAAQTPALDALAARGVRFSNATTVTPLTLPAHASLMTGTFPSYHGVRDNAGFYLDDDQVTVAEVLRARGYRTGGFVSAFVLDGRWGLKQGFDRYFDDFDLAKYGADVGLDAVQRPGSQVVDRAIEWIDQDRSRPFLAWVHLYEPHAPYEPPADIRARFPPTTTGAYDAEIATADAQVGRLLDHLKAAGLLERTIVIALGDHGESLGEHGELEHGFFVYDATLRIPLIIAGPGVPARVVADQAQILDVMPTILDLIGIDAPPAVQGRSLLHASSDKRLEVAAVSETWYPRHHFGWSELVALRDGRYKFIAAPTRELYDIETDPGETRNLAASNPGRADALERALRDQLVRTRARGTPPAPRRVDPAVEERLRALGYVAGSINARHLEDRPRSDPKDKIGLFNLLKQAADDSIDGRTDDAITKVRQALSADPEMVEAYTVLGNLQRKTARDDAGVAAYRRALALDPENQSAAFNLALAYAAAGRLDDAAAGFARVLALNPHDTKSQRQLADIWMRRRDFTKARSILERALAERVDRPALLTRLGECEIELRQYDEAAGHLRDALQEKPDQPAAHYDLGLIHEIRSETQNAIAEYEAELRADPKMYRAHFNLAKLLAAGGRRDESALHFEQAVEANPAFGSGYLYLAKARLDLGDLAGAEAAAVKGNSLGADAEVAPLGHYVLADVYSRLGRQQDAAREAAAGRRLEKRDN